MNLVYSITAQSENRKFPVGYTTAYRFGFNGKEMDNETYGTGNEYDYGFRVYNPRLGKFLSVDPLTMSYPWYTPYQFAGNKPIWAIDIDGLEEQETTECGYLITATYAIITKGPGKLSAASDIIAKQKDVNEALNKNTGIMVKMKNIDNSILKADKVTNFIGPLPEDGSLDEEMVHINVQFNINIVDGGDLENAMSIVYKNGPDGGAVIQTKDPSFFVDPEHPNDPASPGIYTATNKISLNPTYFEPSHPDYTGFDSFNPNGIINTILHEGPGHDMGLNHPKGIYPIEGLMKDTGGPVITPTSKDIQQIIQSVPKKK